MTTEPHLADTIAVNTAIARLEDFVAAYPDGAMPRVDDLRLVIEAAKRGADVVKIRGLESSRSSRLGSSGPGSPSG